MVFLKLVHTEYQVNHKTQPFCVKVVHLVPNGFKWCVEMEGIWMASDQTDYAKDR